MERQRGRHSNSGLPPCVLNVFNTQLPRRILKYSDSIVSELPPPSPIRPYPPPGDSGDISSLESGNRVEGMSKALPTPTLHLYKGNGARQLDDDIDLVATDPEVPREDSISGTKQKVSRRVFVAVPSSMCIHTQRYPIVAGISMAAEA